VKRPKLSTTDRILWVWLSSVWSEWRSSVFIVKAATVIAWHRKGFRLFCTWKVRHGKPGRPMVPRAVRELIRIMSRENPIWGALRIHGELLKLGIDIGETSVSKYMVRRRRPRLVKKLERAEDKERMMVRFDEEDPSGAPVSVRDRDRESAASAAE
jgi:putative transposase